MGWYTWVEAKSESEARRIYFDKFGDKWSFTYTDPGFQEQITKYNLEYEPFEFLELCCQVQQDKYLELKRKAEANGRV